MASKLNARSATAEIPRRQRLGHCLGLNTLLAGAAARAARNDVGFAGIRLAGCGKIRFLSTTVSSHLASYQRWDNSGCSKRPSSKAAASEEATRTLAVRGGSERRENAPGGLFQHPARRSPSSAAWGHARDATISCRLSTGRWRKHHTPRCDPFNTWSTGAWTTTWRALTIRSFGRRSSDIGYASGSGQSA